MSWTKINEELYTHSQAPFILEKIDGTWYIFDIRDKSQAIPFSDIFNNPVFPVDLSNSDVLVNSLASSTYVNANHLRGEAANTPATPAHSFKTEISSGMYRISAGKIGFASLGSRVGEFGANYGGFTGNVIQSVFAQTNTQKTNATSTYVNVGMPVTITPKYNNSKILILYFVSGCYSGVLGGMQFKLYKNGSAITDTFEDLQSYGGSSDVGGKYSGMFLDSPATTSSVTYEPYFVSRNPPVSVFIQNNNSYSNIILLEIQQ